jgi:hypothetical protein
MTKLSVPMSAVEIELLHTLEIAVLRNPSVELTRAGINDGAVWRRYGSKSGTLRGALDAFEQPLARWPSRIRRRGRRRRCRLWLHRLRNQLL